MVATSRLRRCGNPALGKDGPGISPDTAVAVGPPTSRESETAPEQVRLALLGAFDLRIAGAPVSLPMNGQRLLAFLALHGRPLTRSFVAGSLWLDSTDDRAAGSLRSALWRLNREGRLIEVSGEMIRLVSHVAVDVAAAVAQAHRLLDPANDECPSFYDVRLRDDLLPDWYDDWLAFERERFRQLRVHALECLCERLIASERFGEAIETGLAVATVEPLRESAHRILIRIHLAEGNRGAALAQYHRFRALLHDELGLEPSPEMHALVAAVTDR
jgi:DNA-binding SARP family transcriptional activator